MATFIEYLRRPFKLLHAHTSDQTTNRGVYADTRSRDEHFSIANTQSGTSTYAAHRDRDRATPESVLSRGVDASDGTDSGSRRARRPSASDD